MLIIIESGWWAYRIFPILSIFQIEFFTIKVKLEKKKEKLQAHIAVRNVDFIS